jgi:hypothetical protein
VQSVKCKPIFLLVYKRWLCNPQLAANRSKKNGCNEPTSYKSPLKMEAAVNVKIQMQFVQYFRAGIRHTRLHWKKMEHWSEAGTVTRVYR